MVTKRTLRRVIPYIVLICALVSGLVAVKPAIDFLNARLHELQISLVEAIERATKLKVSYSHISPSLLLRADINNFRLERPDGSVFFSAVQVRISYSILEFLTGSPFSAVKSVETVGSELHFDLEQDPSRFGEPTASKVPETGDIAGRIKNGFDQVGRLLPPGIKFDFLDTAVTISGPGNRFDFQVSHASLMASPDKLETSISVRLDRAISASMDFLGELSGELLVEGQYFRQNRQLQTRVATKAITTHWGVLAPQNLSLIIDSDEIRLNRIVDQEPVDLQVRWNIKNNTLEASVQSEKWLLGSQFRANPDAANWVSLMLSGRYTTDLQASYHLNSDAYDYRIKLDALAREVQDDDVLLKLDLQGDQDHLPKGSMLFEMPGSSVHYKTNALSAGQSLEGDLQLQLSSPWLPFPCTFSGPVTAKWINQGFVIDSPVFRAAIDGFPIVGSNCVLEYRQNTLGFRLETWPAQSSQAEARIALDGKLGKTGLALEAQIAGLRLAESAALIRPLSLILGAPDPGLSDLSALPRDLELNAQLRVDTRTGFKVGVSGFRLVTSALDGGNRSRAIISGDMDFDGKKLTVSNGFIDTPKTRYGLQGNAELETDGSVTARIGLQDGTNPSWDITGYHAPNGQFNIQGPFGIFASGIEEFALGKGAQLNLSFQNIPIASLGERALVSGSLSGRIDSQGKWLAHIQSLDFLSLGINPGNPQKTGRLTIRDADIANQGIILNDIRYQDTQSSLVGKGNISWELTRLPDCQWTVDLHGSPSLQSPIVNPRTETLGVQGQVADGQFSTVLSWTDAPIARFIDEAIKGYYDVSAKVSFGVDDPNNSLVVTGLLKTPRALLNKDPILLSTDFSFNDKKLALNELSLSLLEHHVKVTGLLADLGVGSLGFTAAYNNVLNPQMVPVRALGKATWNPLAASIQSMVFDGFQASLLITDMPGVDKLQHSYELHAQGVSGTLNFNETSSQTIKGRIQTNGNFQLNLQKPLPITATVSGTLKGAQIEANITNIGLDIAHFSSFLDLGVFKLKAGALGGAVRVVGDINDPDFFGSLRGNNLAAQVSFIPDVITSALGVLVFEEKKIRLLALNALAGTAQAQVDGDFSVKRLNVESFKINVDIPQDGKGVHVIGDFPMVNVDGIAKGHLGIGWSGNTLKLEGQIKADNASLQLLQFSAATPKPDPASTPAASPNAAASEPMFFDVAFGFTSGKSVEFFLPNKTSPILRTNFDIGQTIKILYNSQAGTWSLNGNLKARGGEILWLKRNFVMRQAALVFNENQDKFDPRISGQAETRMVSNGKPIKVTMVLENNSLAKLTPRIITDVPLSSDQLAALISGDIFQGNSADTRGLANRAYDAVTALAGTASQLYFEGPALANLTEPIRTALGLDLLSLRTNLISNALVASGFKFAGYNSTDTQYNPVFQYFDNTSLQVGKFLGNDGYIEILGRFQKEAVSPVNSADWGNNFGKALSSTIGLGFELDLSTEWAIPPFFNIGWSSSLKDWTSLDKWLKANAFTFSLRLP